VSIRVRATNYSVVNSLAALLESTPLEDQWIIQPATTRFDSELPLINYTIDLIARDPISRSFSKSKR
ncbi:MAG: hypothetical protein AAF623_07485, partial [Planctomycetota bacterium]